MNGTHVVERCNAGNVAFAGAECCLTSHDLHYRYNKVFQTFARTCQHCRLATTYNRLQFVLASPIFGAHMQRSRVTERLA